MQNVGQAKTVPSGLAVGIPCRSQSLPWDLLIWRCQELNLGLSACKFLIQINSAFKILIYFNFVSTELCQRHPDSSSFPSVKFDFYHSLVPFKSGALQTPLVQFQTTSTSIEKKKAAIESSEGNPNYGAKDNTPTQLLHWESSQGMAGVDRT